jgi:hypothetical protein
VGENDVRLRGNYVLCQLDRSATTGRVAILDAQVVAFCPSQLLEFLPQCDEARLHPYVMFAKADEHADMTGATCLLPECNPWCRNGSGSEHADDLPSSHSITSSA